MRSRIWDLAILPSLLSCPRWCDGTGMDHLSRRAEGGRNDVFKRIRIASEPTDRWCIDLPMSLPGAGHVTGSGRKSFGCRIQRKPSEAAPSPSRHSSRVSASPFSSPHCSAISPTGRPSTCSGPISHRGSSPADCLSVPTRCSGRWSISSVGEQPAKGD